MSKRTTKTGPNRAKTPPAKRPPVKKVARTEPTTTAPPFGARLGVKIAAFVTLVVVCAVAGVAYVIHAKGNDPRSGKPQELSQQVSPARMAELMSAPHLLFENTDLGPAYGHVEVVPLTDPGGVRAITPLTCDRVATAKTVGVCLTIDHRRGHDLHGQDLRQQLQRVAHVLAARYPESGPALARWSLGGHDGVRER